MNLSTLERVVLLTCLPAEGKLTDYRVLRDLKMSLHFTNEEIASIHLKENEGAITWDGEAPKEIDFGQRAKELIVEALKKLDDEGKVNEQNFSLFEKFGLAGEGE